MKTSINAMGIIFANMHDSNLPEIIAHRTMASVPFGGRYRMVDFVLSGMTNAGIHNIGMVVRQNYQSLMDHLGSGREWDLARKRGGLVIFPPGGRDHGKLYQGRIDALNNVMEYLTHRKEELVVMSDCDTASDLDYLDLVHTHRQSGADVTAVYEKSGIPEGMLEDNITYQIGDDNFVNEIRINDYKKGSQNLSMYTYVIGRELLISLVRDAVVRGLTHFEEHILARNLKLLKVRGYYYSGYRARICDMTSYFDQNLRLLKPENLEKLFPQDRPVNTKVRDEAPVRYAIGSKAVSCLVADGCIIEGELENCLLFRGVRVGKGAKLKNCVIMQGTEIAPGALLENVVTDKNVFIGENQVLRGAPKYPMFIAKGSNVV